MNDFEKIQQEVDATRPTYDHINHLLHISENENFRLREKISDIQRCFVKTVEVLESVIDSQEPSGRGPDPITESRDPILCLDFDGVLAQYEQGWPGRADLIREAPVPGAQDFVRRAQEAGWRVMVFSARSGQRGGIQAMREWLKRFAFPEVELPGRKPPITLTIDDQAIRFEGAWPDPKELFKLKPWYWVRE